MIDPIGYLEMIWMLDNCSLVMTDSGGLQKEAYFFKKPCIILRPQTEWIEIVETKSAVITDTSAVKILEVSNYFLTDPELSFPPIFGNGNAASFIVEEMISQFS